MLDRAALGLLRFRDQLARRPEGAALSVRLGQRRIGDEAALHGRLEDRHHRSGHRIGEFRQHVPGRGFRQRRGRTPAWRMANCSAMSAISSKPTTRLPLISCASDKKVHRGLRRGHGDEGRLARLRLREQLHHGGGDDAQRAFRADEQVAQVIAGIVLAQAFQSVPHPAIGEHHLEAEAEIARVAIGDDVEAAGIGREIAADPAGAFRREAQGKQPVHGISRVLHRLQHRAGFDRDRVVSGIDVEDAGHAVERQHHLVACVGGNLPAAQAGVAALRHDRRARLVGDGENAGDFLGGARAQHERRAAGPDLPPLAHVAVHFGGIADGVLLADHGGEAVQWRRS